MNRGGGAELPIGCIVLWSGAIVNIPLKYVLCDGNSGTPDLRDRFVVGAGNTYAVSDTGGEATHTLSEAEMPTHFHTTINKNTASGGNNIPMGSSFTGSETGSWPTDSKGSSDPHENRPPYYALAYIMKVS